MSNMNVDLPEIVELKRLMERLLKEFKDFQEKTTPAKEWYSLKEACAIKGVNYNTVSSLRKHQPNRGKEDGIVCGVRMWRKETILRWIKQTDADEAATA